MYKGKLQGALGLLLAAIVFVATSAGAGSDVEKRIAEFKAGLAKGGQSQKEEPVPAHGAASASPHQELEEPKARENGKGGNHRPGKTDHAATTRHDSPEIGAEEALQKLLEGNRRYAADRAKGPNRSRQRRGAVFAGQHPIAAVVSCSDSRVPPELVFDQGVGDLFVVRSAGNVLDGVGMGSIEYAVEHLGVKLIVVLGHERCGAVDATVKGGEASGHVKTVVEAIRPAVEKARGKHGDLLCNSVKANVKLTAEKLKGSSPLIAELIEDGTLRVVGGYYDLQTGAVSLTYRPHI